MKKRLYRSRSNRVFSGIIGGIGKYADIDPVILRLVWILIVVFTGFIPGIVAYLLAAAVTPYRPETAETAKQEKPKKKK